MPSEGVTPGSDLPSILDALDEQQLPELLRQARHERHDPGSTLFREGTDPLSVMQIRQGRVKVTCLTPPVCSGRSRAGYYSASRPALVG